MRSIKNCYNLLKDLETSNIQFAFRLLGFLLAKKICIRFPDESLPLTRIPHDNKKEEENPIIMDNAYLMSCLPTFPILIPPFQAEVEIDF